MASQLTREVGMDIKDYLLVCISEESGEIAQAVGKSLRFGLLDKNPITNAINWLELRKEIHDLIAVYEMFCDEFDRVETLDRRLIDEKKNKVLNYMDYSESIGRL